MNGVGLEFNHLFGFGVLDAGSMVTLAKQWRTVPARYHCEAGEYAHIRFVKTLYAWLSIFSISYFCFYIVAIFTINFIYLFLSFHLIKK